MNFKPAESRDTSKPPEPINLSAIGPSRCVLTQLIQQVRDGAQDHLNGALGLTGIVLCFLGIV